MSRSLGAQQDIVGTAFALISFVRQLRPATGLACVSRADADELPLSSPPVGRGQWTSGSGN